MGTETITSATQLADAIDKATVGDIKKEQVSGAQAPDELRGKSVSDLAKELEDAKKRLDERDNQVKELSYKFEYLENLQKQIQAQRESQPTYQPQQFEAAVEWDYDKPVDSVRRVVELERNKWEKEQTERERQKQAQEAVTCYTEGRKQAFRQFPKMLEGIEKEVETAVFESYRRGIISPYDMRTTDPWFTAAQLIHLRNGNIDRIKSAIQPMRAGSEELPTSGRAMGVSEPSEPSLDYTDRETLEVIDQMGINREEAEKIVKEEQERVRRGKR